MTRLLPERASRRTSALAAACWRWPAGCANMGAIALASPHARRAEPSAWPAAPAAQATHRARSQWWRAFGDPQLDRLIDQALAGNPNLQVARRAWRARRPVTEVAAPPQPQVNGCARSSRASSFSDNDIYPPPLGGSIQRHGTLQLIGRLGARFLRQEPRRARRGARHGAAPPRPRPKRRACCSPATCARSYVQLARLNDQLAVAQRTLAQRDRTCSWCATACRPAWTRSSSCARARARCPRRASRSKRCKEQIALAQHALAALVGARPMPAAGADAAVAGGASSRGRCRRSCRPTCWAAAPTSPPRAGAWKPRPATCRTPRRSSIRTSTWWPSPACPASAWASCCSGQPAVGRGPGDPAADLRGRPAARQPARQDGRPRRRGRKLQRRRARRDARRRPTRSLERSRSRASRREQREAQAAAEGAYDDRACSATAPASAPTWTC